NHLAFLRELKRLGYEEGGNIRIEWTWAAQQYDQFPQLAAKLSQLKLDVLVTQTTAASQAAHKATQVIPIVFVGVRDPLAAGLVASLGRPGGNVTGVTLTPNAELVGKQLELLREILPKLSQLAMFFNPDTKVQAEVVETMKEA